MRTKKLQFACPHTPLPDPAAPQLVLNSTDSNPWRLTVIRAGTHRQINTVERFIKVGLNVAHFTDFCLAFQETGATTKPVTFTYEGAVVHNMAWKKAGVTISVPLPDSAALAEARKDVVGFALTSAGELLSELRQLNDNASNILLLLEKRNLRDSDIHGIEPKDDDADLDDAREVVAGKRQ
jgi:hypothetical protein